MRAVLLAASAVACGKAAAPPAIEATAAIVDVTVVDGDHELPHQTVLVKGDRIVAVGATSTTPAAPSAKRIDGAGKWLIPGLVDMHVHFNDERDALLFVANGVTTVRNMWGFPNHLAWKQRHDWLGPTIYTTGPIVDGNPPTWPGSVVVETPEAATAEVDAEKRAGWDYIKVYSGLKPDVYDAIAAEAKKQGMRFVGHVPGAVTLQHALAAGQASVEHMTGFPEAVTAGATPEQIAKLAKDSGAAIVPTLIVLENFAHLDHPEVLLANPDNKYVAPAVVAGWDPSHDFRLATRTAADFERMRARNELAEKLVKALVDGGALVLAGTDTPNPFVLPGFSLHDELVLLVRSGMTSAQALHAATAAPAEWLGARGELGTIAPKARADLVLLDADPLADIRATTKRAGVMLRGTWYSRAELDARLEALAKSYREVKDRFADVPPLPSASGATVLTFVETFAGVESGRERMAITDGPSGRVVDVQAAQDPPSPRLVTAHLELDATGAIVKGTLDVDGARTTLTRTGDKLTLGDKQLPADTLFDADILATMIPFADRALHSKDPLTVAGKSMSMGQLGDISYAFTRKTDKLLEFKVTSRLGTVPGSYEVDDKGLPVAVSVRTPMGEWVGKRQ